MTAVYSKILNKANGLRLNNNSVRKPSHTVFGLYLKYGQFSMLKGDII